MKKAVVKKQNAVKGFLPATYAVFCGKYILKIFLTKDEAQEFADEYNRGV